MKNAFSLGWKILAWFFVNLAIVVGVVAVFFRAQFNVGVNALLTGSTGVRLEALARPLVEELRERPPDQWHEALATATAAWREKGIQTALYRNRGEYVAGDVTELPAEVADVIKVYDARKRVPVGRWRPGFGAGNGDGAREFRPAGPPPDFEEIIGPLYGPWPKEATSPRFDAMPKGEFQKFMLTSDQPKLYWAGVHLDSRPGDAPLDVTLVLASKSLRGGGLFFDYIPWLWLGGGLVLLSFLIWAPFVYRITRALGQLTQNAETIAHGNFTPPPAMRRRDELGRLNRAHQYMADRLEGFVNSQKRFLGDTAHELLSPLARLEAMLSILQQRTGDSERNYADRALGEVRHVSSLVHDLLSFTKVGLQREVELQEVPLKPLVREVIEREAPGQAEVVEHVPEALTVRAEPELLARALANVVRNAVRYAGGQGLIEIEARREGERETLVVVSDHGPGVPEESLPRLFDPFYRPEISRTRETGGSGLGLAIVKSCLAACQGRVSAQNRQPRGFQVEMWLQAA